MHFLLEGWTSDIARGDAVSQMLLLKVMLKFTFAILISQENVTCVLYTIHYPLDAVCLPCLFGRL